MDRRRVASLLAIALASAASLATSPAPQTPPPTVDGTSSGSVTLSRDAPVAVRPLLVRVTWPDETPTGRRLSVSFAARVRAGSVAGDAVRLSVVPATTPEPGRPDWSRAFRRISGSEPAARSWDLECVERACEGRFALVIEPEDPEAVPVKVEWDLVAHVELWTGLAAGVPAVELDVESGDPALPRLARSVAQGERTRLDVDHRLALWRVEMRLGNDPLIDPPGWPVIVSARLAVSSAVLEWANRVTVPSPTLFIEGLGDARNVGTTVYQSSDVIEFDPFWACVAGESCRAGYTIGLAWENGYPEVAFDAAWDLDVRAVATDGSEVPVSMEIEPVPPMTMVRGQISGTSVVGRNHSSGSFNYHVEEVGGGPRIPLWEDGLLVPVNGMFSARMRSSGRDPFPANVTLAFGPKDTYMVLRLDENVVSAFTPGGRTCRVGNCGLDGTLGPSLGFSGGEPKSDWEVTIDWVLELEVGTSVRGGGTELVITEVPGS